MLNADSVKHVFLRSLAGSARHEDPYRHWLLTDCLPDEVGRAIAALPIPVARIADTRGKRETHNDSRVYFSVAGRAQYPVMEAVARAFQDPGMVAAIEDHCDTRLGGTSLRIEYCQDTDGFWLAPHTDIGVKKFTMLIYLSDDAGSESWGTDIYRDAGTHAGVAPFGFRKGMIFVPAGNTWHGFEKRPIHGVRKSIIVNYVGPQWRNRHELAFPDQPVG
ncbi:MAG TPA: 2OG-Fe(II) oxygenase [Gammaproteobacteria bacterium]|nr:2OG-Fe(II) oxygenase [Gammaproteobacteria bacterium]